MKKQFAGALGITALLSVLFSTLGVAPRAHVLLLSPMGGEIFHVGEEVRVSWQRIQAHNQSKWDVYYSENGGASFVPVVTNISVDESSAVWTVSKTTEPTSIARIKIVQDNDNSQGVPDYESTSFDFSIVPTSVDTEDEFELPLNHNLTDVFPNPFSSDATVRFSVAKSEQVRLAVFDVQGREMSILTDRMYATGSHEVTWRPGNIPAGSYFIRMTAGDYSSTRPLVLNR